MRGEELVGVRPDPLDADDTAIVPVCIESGSSAAQRGDGALSGLIHDDNPSLADVIRHVRNALADSWERYSSVRFQDFETSCGALSSDVRARYIGLYIHPQAGNFYSSSNPRRVNFKPWGNNFNRCIAYNGSTTHVEYDFDYAEQYGIHEFGHAIGFQHEWRHPLTPADCAARTPAGERPYGISQASTSYPPPVGGAFVPNRSQYDWDSIME